MWICYEVIMNLKNLKCNHNKKIKIIYLQYIYFLIKIITDMLD